MSAFSVGDVVRVNIPPEHQEDVRIEYANITRLSRANCPSGWVAMLDVPADPVGDGDGFVGCCLSLLEHLGNA